MRTAVSVRAIGCKAHAALERSRGRLTALPGFTHAPYACADGEIVWVGAGEVAMHPRAVVLRDTHGWMANARLLAGAVMPGVGAVMPGLGAVMTCPGAVIARAGAVTPWRPAPLPANAAGAAALREGCARLHRDLHRIGEPRGFALLLAGRLPAFPLGAIAPRVHALARAFRNADVDAVHATAPPLLGLGPGLTPSGDDLVGAALFARRAIAHSPTDARVWSDLAMRLADAAQSRSHAIGAALFRDLADGESFGPLHDLAAALSRRADRAESLAAARAVVAIGHSSGWEMLAGFIIGITGALDAAGNDKGLT